MHFYPRSFLRLILLGNVLTALPLLVAIGYAAVAVDRMSEQSQAVARQAALAGRLSWELPEELRHMERNLRQFEVLRDATLLEDYAAVRKEWRRSMADLAAIPILGQMSGRIGQMLEAEAAAYGRIGPKGERLGELKTTVGGMIERTGPLLGESGRVIDAERESLRARADGLRQRLAVGMVLALATVATLMLIGRQLMARLLSRFERAVLALGEGRLDRRIRLKGPDDMQRIGRRLEWLRQRLVALEEQRTRVLRHVSHELKTPLAALREGASLLSDQVAGALSPQQAKIVGIMHNNAMRLQTLIEGLLRLQQAEHAMQRVERQPLRLDELIQQVLATHQLAARDKRLRITGTLAPLAVNGGHEEVTTIVNNLVANAIKYAPEGGNVRITLSREGSRAVLDVSDDGPGVLPEDREKIFEPFYRSAAARDASGIGLGLAIAHEFVLAHQGSLELVADGAPGAHFRATLPLWEAKA